MSKAELMRRILEVDAAADTEFLVEFSEAELDQYLHELTQVPLAEPLVSHVISAH